MKIAKNLMAETYNRMAAKIFTEFEISTKDQADLFREIARIIKEDFSYLMYNERFRSWIEEIFRECFWNADPYVDDSIDFPHYRYKRFVMDFIKGKKNTVNKIVFKCHFEDEIQNKVDTGWFTDYGDDFIETEKMLAEEERRIGWYY